MAVDWLRPISRRLLPHLTIGILFGLYSSTLVWVTLHRGSLVLLALGSCIAAGLALQGSRVVPLIGYALGLLGTGTAVYATPFGILGYAAWTALGTVVLFPWGGSIGFGAIAAAGYGAARVGAHLAAREPLPTVTILTGVAAVALIHAGTRLLARRIRERDALAVTDLLTGVANRRLLQWRLNEELAEARRRGTSLALLYTDLDQFKRVNDKFGHHAGDRVLVKVARALHETVRAHDVVARVGGDEFVVLAPGLGEAEAHHLAARLEEAVAGAGLPMPLGLSVGWVLASRDGDTADALLDQADAALFGQKRQTRQAGRSLVSELLEALRGLPDGARHLVRLLDMEDFELEVEEHLAQVGHWSLELARRLGLSPARHRTLAQAALLHDVGKLGIPQSLLLKHTPLSPAERALLVQHVAKGVALLRALDVDETVIGIVAAHHERWDGTGYPARLAGEAIPIEARILAIADSYDAMTTHRVYQKALSRDMAIAELRREAGRQFDPQLVGLLTALLRTG